MSESSKEEGPFGQLKIQANMKIKTVNPIALKYL